MNKAKAMNVFKSNLSGEQLTDMCRIFCLEGNNYDKMIEWFANGECCYGYETIRAIQEMGKSDNFGDVIRDCIYRTLNNLVNDELVRIHNEFNFEDKYIFKMSEVNEHFTSQQMSPLEIIGTIDSVNFFVDDDYATYRHDKLISFKACDVERYVSDTSEIIDRCIDELESFCVPEIQELLDVYEAFMESEAE